MDLKPLGYILVDSSSPDGLSHLVSGLLMQGNFRIHGNPFSATYDDGSVVFLQAVVELGE